jgi:hypothetical protein
MSDTKKGSKELDMKAVPITTQREISGVGLPSDDFYDKCSPFTSLCEKMKPEILDVLRTVNPADLKVLLRLGFINESMLTATQKASVSISDAVAFHPEWACKDFESLCPRVNRLRDELLDRVINPADLEVLTRYGVVIEAALTAKQQAELKEIRKK